MPGGFLCFGEEPELLECGGQGEGAMGTDGNEKGDTARVQGMARPAKVQVAVRSGAGLWVAGQRGAEQCWRHRGDPGTGTSLRLLPLHPAQICQTQVHAPAKAAAVREVLPALMSPAHHRTARGCPGAEPRVSGHAIMCCSLPAWAWVLWDAGCSWGCLGAARRWQVKQVPACVVLISSWPASVQPTALRRAPRAVASQAHRGANEERAGLAAPCI